MPANTCWQVITAKCSRILSADGSASSFGSAEATRLIRSTIEPMASEGLRTIGIAYKDFDSEPNWDDEAAVLSDLTLIMIAGKARLFYLLSSEINPRDLVI